MPLPPGAEIAASHQLFILDEPSGLAQALTQRLRDQGHPVRLASLAEEPPPTGSGPAEWIVIAPAGSATAARVFPIIGLLKRWRSWLAGGRLWLVQRMDGGFALHAQPLEEPAQGAWAGLAKTLAHEWPDVRVQAIDLDAKLDAFAGAELLAKEWPLAGPVEVGLSETGRFGVELRPVVALPGSAAGRLPSAGSFLLTGGARGITAAAALRLVQAGARRLVIVGRTLESGTEDPTLAGCQTETELRQALLKEGCAGPREVRQRLAAILSQRELRRNLTMIRQAGAEVIYLAADLRHADQLAKRLRQLPASHQPIVGLIHGAGVLADRLVEDLTAQDYTAVWETKVDGLSNLLSVINAADLRWLVLFSSTTARLGRKGQAAYAMANEALNKMAREFHRAQPQCRVQAINWGPWAGGMVTPQLARLFAAEGVELIPQKAGTDLLLNEMLADVPRPTELVVLARSQASAAKPERIVVRPEESWLQDHCLAGRPVVPLAVALAWCHAAASRNRTGESPRGFTDVALLKGMVLDNGPLEVEVASEGNLQLVRARRKGDRWSPRLRAKPVFGGEAVRLFSDRTRLSSEPGLPPSYSTELFHGPTWQLLEEILACDSSGVVVSARPTPASLPLGGLVWMLDAAFQALIVFSQRQLQSPALPMGFDHLLLREECIAEAIRVVARARPPASAQFLADVDIEDSNGRLLATLAGVRMIFDAGLRGAFQAPWRQARQPSHA